MTVVVGLAALLAAMPVSLRWLRVAQREHYAAGSVTRFALRWWRRLPYDLPLAVVIVVAAALGTFVSGWQAASLVALAGVALGPTRLTVRGTTAPLAWTRRLQRVAALASVPMVAGVVATLLGGHPAPAVWGVILIPVWIDGALGMLAPVERRLGRVWVDRAAARLTAADLDVVAITGSYGKTTTKAYVTHLLSGMKNVVASPASFNNRMGLARAVNEHLAPGTEVFVAEMGTYGPGEIAELCAWIPPDVAVITAIGPVHLERMGSEEAIVDAKREILERAPVAVISVDHPLLAAVASEEATRRKVITCSVTGPADVVVDQAGRVTVAGRAVGHTDVRGLVERSNLAVALGAVVGLGVDPEAVAGRVTGLPVVAHRRAKGTSERGFVIIDDTFNANPAGAAAALVDLADAAPTGRRVVVTPGLVELGRLQREENRRFAAAAARVATDLVVVGETNRRALVEGAAGQPVSIIVVPTRAEAVAWVRSHLGPGDAVLYENDLPDHYP